MSVREFIEWIEVLRLESGQDKRASGENWMAQKAAMIMHANIMQGKNPHGRH